jgi:hypothetical protein
MEILTRRKRYSDDREVEMNSRDFGVVRGPGNLSCQMM